MEAIKHEIKKIGSLALFFFIGFGYILLLMKLFLEEYDINTYVFSKVIIGSLIAAKAVAIMDATPWINRFRHYPRYIHVLYKTFVYSLAALLIRAIENLFQSYHQTKKIASALYLFLETRHFSQFLAVTLCIAVIFLIHNLATEIDTYLGKGTIKRFLSSRP